MKSVFVFALLFVSSLADETTCTEAVATCEVVEIPPPANGTDCTAFEEATVALECLDDIGQENCTYHDDFKAAVAQFDELFSQNCTDADTDCADECEDALGLRDDVLESTTKEPTASPTPEPTEIPVTEEPTEPTPGCSEAVMACGNITDPADCAEVLGLVVTTGCIASVNETCWMDESFTDAVEDLTEVACPEETCAAECATLTNVTTEFSCAVSYSNCIRDLELSELATILTGGDALCDVVDDVTEAFTCLNNEKSECMMSTVHMGVVSGISQIADYLNCNAATDCEEKCEDALELVFGFAGMEVPTAEPTTAAPTESGGSPTAETTSAPTATTTSAPTLNGASTASISMMIVSVALLVAASS